MLTPFLSKQRSHKDPVISIALIIQVHYSDFIKINEIFIVEIFQFYEFLLIKLQCLKNILKILLF